jgi:hypothetical protein
VPPRGVFFGQSGIRSSYPSSKSENSKVQI